MEKPTDGPSRKMNAHTESERVRILGHVRHPETADQEFFNVRTLIDIYIFLLNF